VIPGAVYRKSVCAAILIPSTAHLRFPALRNNPGRRLMRLRQSRAPATNAELPNQMHDRGVAHPSDFGRGAQHALSPYQPNQLGGGGIESTSLRSGCLHNGIHIAKQAAYGGIDYRPGPRATVSLTYFCAA